MNTKLSAALRAAVLILVSTQVFADTGQGPVAYWMLDGDASDASGNRHPGNLIGNVQPTQDRNGDQGKGLYFDRLGSYIQVPLFPTYDLNVNPNTGFTVAQWVKADPFQFFYDGHYDFIDKTHTGPPALPTFTGYTIQGAPWSTAVFGFGTSCGWQGTGINGDFPLDNEWHHVAGVIAPPNLMG